ncbi:MAG: glycoside hydrolase 43 family protein [Clostridia bacterium]|nr:glycoside hydrolase 43 family protein [Clostridia bacterium]
MSFINENVTIKNADLLEPQSMWNADLGNKRFSNPVLYADYSDPDAIRVGEDYFMIASSFCNSPAIPVLHSKDLVNWKVINYVLDKVPEERYKDPIHGCGVWAPAIRYHDGIFYACFPMPDEGIYMSTTKDPWGKWSEPVNIRPGAGWIDPCPFWDDDGRAYLVAGVAKSRIGYKSVLHMVEMQPDGMGLIGEEVKIFDGNLNDQVTIEGPKLYKRNGWYYIFAPAGGVKVGWQTVLRSRNIFGPYEYKVVMRRGDSPVNGPHQGAWVDTVTGQDWFLHFQDVYAAGRITHLQPMSWENDWPVIGIAKNGNDYGEPVMEFDKPDVGTKTYEICEPATSDDFRTDRLGLQWQWNANYQNSWYKCTDSGLLLNAVSVETGRPLSDVRNLLLQKWPAPEFTCITRIDVTGMAEGDTAGIVSMGMHYAGLCVKKDGVKLQVIAVEGEQKFNGQEVLTTENQNKSAEVSADKIWFMYNVERTGYKDINAEEKHTPVETVTLSYSTDGVNFVKCVSAESLAGRWVGVKNGIYCTHEGENGGHIIAEYVKYVKNVKSES